MSEGRRLPAIAVGMAVLAVVLSAIATVVVIARDPGAEAAAEPARPTPAARQVEATDLVALERDSIEPASQNGAVIGVRVTDPDLRHVLGLDVDDVVTAISGRPVRRQFDIHDVIAGASLMNTNALFVELMRGDEPVLVRWDLAGDLRTARRALPPRSPRPGLPSPTSPVRPVRDPLIDTVTAVDDHHLSAPRATIEQIAASPKLYAQGARVLRGYPSGGRPAGVRLYLLRPTSVFYALGLRSMDTITAVNGISVDDPAKLADVYEQVKSAATLRIEIDRRGTAEVIEITQTP
ncbi:MAG: hypothetical protein JNL83_12495 [Myxococcales bacterium]|nr:hypothetical protein [Myxococcales bacterium]